MAKTAQEKADLKEYYQLKEADDTAVIVDNVKQDTTAKLVAGKIYIEYRFLHDTLNQRFYWDGNENKLLYTTPSEVTSVAVLPLPHFLLLLFPVLSLLPGSQ